MRRTVLLALLLPILPILAACTHLEKRPSTVTMNDGQVITCPGGLEFFSDIKIIKCFKKDGGNLLTITRDNVKGYTAK